VTKAPTAPPPVLASRRRTRRRRSAPSRRRKACARGRGSSAVATRRSGPRDGVVGRNPGERRRAAEAGPKADEPGMPPSRAEPLPSVAGTSGKTGKEHRHGPRRRPARARRPGCHRPGARRGSGAGAAPRRRCAAPGQGSPPPAATGRDPGRGGKQRRRHQGGDHRAG
jgi:hypothetical protein